MTHQKIQLWLLRVRSEGHEVLILKTRADRGEFWQPVTGKVEAGESIEAAAVREGVEETGYDLTGLVKRLGFEFEFESRWGGKCRETVFYAILPQDQAAQDYKLSHEHQAEEWTTLTEALPKIQFKSNQEALIKLRSKIYA